MECPRRFRSALDVGLGLCGRARDYWSLASDELVQRLRSETDGPLPGAPSAALCAITGFYVVAAEHVKWWFSASEA